MKKMFFTAIALVAFSATSTANTVEVKEVTISEGEKEVVIKSREECMLAATYTYEFLVDYCGVRESVALLNSLTAVCK